MFFFGAIVFKFCDEIKLLNENRATGIDKISAKILKLNNDAILHPLTEVVSVSMRIGKFLQFLKRHLFTQKYKFVPETGWI